MFIFMSACKRLVKTFLKFGQQACNIMFKFVSRKGSFLGGGLKSQQTKNNCITFVQRGPNIFDGRPI